MFFSSNNNKWLIAFLLMALASHSNAQNKWWKKDKSSSKQEMGQQTIQKNRKSNKQATSHHQPVFSTNDTMNTPTVAPGNIRVIKRDLVQKIINYKGAAIPPYSEPTMMGYRIQLFFDQSKRKVDSVRKEVLRMDDETKIYVKYNAPNYYLFIGNYRTQLQAEKSRSNWIADFPAAIIKRTIIFLPELKYPINKEKEEAKSEKQTE